MRTKTIAILSLSFALSFAACRRAPTDPDAGRAEDAGTRDAGPGEVDAGGTDAGSADAGSIDPAQVRALVVALEWGATVASLVTGPLVPDANMLDQMSDTASDMTIRERVESGVATNSIVTEATCVAFDWTLRTATITFTGCTSEATGLTIDGSVSFRVTLRPTLFEITLTSLTIGGTTIGGTVSLVVTGADGARTHALDTDLSWTDGTTANALTLTGVSVTTDSLAMTTTLDGAFSLTTDGATVSGSLDALTWQLPDCHPSSGSASLMFTGALPVIVTFLPTTPTAGTVDVQIPPLPATEMDLLTACAP